MKDNIIEEGWMTVNEAAALAGYTVGHIRHLARAGALLAVRVGRDWLINCEALLQYQRAMEALGTDKHNPWREERPDLAGTDRGRPK